MGRQFSGDLGRVKSKSAAVDSESFFENDSDEEIYQEIVSGLNRSSLNTSLVGVSVIHGIVFLRGAVFGPEDIVKVEVFASSVKGVEEVRNELYIRS